MFPIKISQFLLFLVSPFLSLVTNFTNYRSRYFPGVLYLFCIFYGYTFTFVSDALDGARIVEKLTFAKYLPFYTFSGLDAILSTGNTEIIENSIIWIVANTFGTSQMLFMVYAAIFGFFYIKNYTIVVSYIPITATWLHVILLTTFMLVIAIWEINGWRMWTASHVFFYASYNLIIAAKRKYGFFLLIFLTPFIHFSFWIPVIVFLIFYLFKYFLSKKILFPLFILSLISSPFEFTNENLINVINIENVQNKISAYGNEDYVESRGFATQSLSFHAKYYRVFLKYALILVFVIILLKLKKNKPDQGKLIEWVLSFGIFSNLLVFVPISNLTRFSLLAYMFYICGILLLIYRNKIHIKRYIYIPVIILLCFFILVELRVGADRFGIYTLLTNPFTVIFLPTEDNTAIINFIK